MPIIKETPRQKMIGILYLVLLGLVALSINTSVLDAFKYLTDSLTNSTHNVQNNINTSFSAFAATKLKDEPERARPAYERAKKVSQYANELDAYIATIKSELENRVGGYRSNGDIKKRESQDISYRMMINQGRAEELKKKINETRNKMLQQVNKESRDGLVLSLNADDPPKRNGIKKSWEDVNFGDGIPLTAALTSLAKIRADLKNTEYEVVKSILGEVDKAVVNLDEFAAVAVAPSSYIIQGQPYKAEVFLTAFDSKTQPEITVNGNNVDVVNGKGQYSVNTTSEGVHRWSATIKVQQTDGTIKEYKTPEQTYRVARPSAVVSADKMNVFYIGVQNPVSVSAPGIPKEDLMVSMTGGSIRGSNGNYTVTVTKPGDAVVSVSAKTSSGNKVIGSTKYRVKTIPDPTVKFAGKTGGRVSTVALKQQSRIFPALEGFEFDANFTIQKFSLVIIKPRADAQVYTGSGNTLSSDMLRAMDNIVPGTRVIFDNIIAVGPDGMRRELNAVSIYAY